MSYFLPRLESGWHADQAILAEDNRVVIIRFGHDWEPACMANDETLLGVSEKVKNFCVIYTCDISKVPDFTKMYELYDPVTTMFFYRNKHIMVDLGTGNNNKINWAIEDKQEMIDLIETVYRGASKGRGLVVSPKDYSTRYKSQEKGKGRAVFINESVARATGSNSKLKQIGSTGIFSKPDGIGFKKVYDQATLAELREIVSNLKILEISLLEFYHLVECCCGTQSNSDKFLRIGLLWDLRKLGITRGWTLKSDSIRKSFGIGLRVEELYTGLNSKDRFDYAVVDLESKRAHLDEFFEELQLLPLIQDDEFLLLGYALLRTKSFTPTHTTPLLNAFRAYQSSFTLAKPFALPQTRYHKSLLLLPLFQYYPSEAVIHLNSMLLLNQIPHKEDLKKIVKLDASNVEEEEFDYYERSKAALAEACTVGSEGSKVLDELLEERLKSLQQKSLEEETPFVGFLYWMMKDREQELNGPTRREWLRTSLRFWETIYLSEADDGNFTKISVVPGQVLFKLTQKICALEVDYQNDTEVELKLFDANPLQQSEKKPASQLMMESIKVMELHASDGLLMNSAHLILKSICLISPNYLLAKNFYRTLISRTDNSFMWHASLIPCTEFLVRNSLPIVGAIRPTDDPQFVYQLYLKITGDGFLWPRQLYGKLWHSLGRIGNFEEISRVFYDYEESGKEINLIVGNKLIDSMILRDQLVKSIKIFNLLSLKLDLTIESYNKFLFYLAIADTDRRGEMITIFSKLFKTGPSPNIQTYNALLAAQVYRRSFREPDLASAGTIYNNILRAQIRPNSQTFSLLIKGFLRFDTTNSIRSAITTFHTAHSMDIPVSGKETKNLMIALVALKRWEETKLIAEAWWRTRTSSDQIEERSLETETAAEKRRIEEYIMKVAGQQLSNAEIKDFWVVFRQKKKEARALKKKEFIENSS